MSVFLLGVGLVACERESQPLPFSVDGEGGVTKTVPAEGAVISSAAGASVQLPAGALGAGTQVSLAQVSAPAGAARSGAAASAGFQLEPAGAVLSRPARVELKFDRKRQDAWLASVVNVTPQGVREIGDTRVDLTTGLVRTGISQLGTLAVVIPEANAVFRVSRTPRRAVSYAAASLAATGTDSISAVCGDPNNRCSGLSVNASGNLLSRVEDAAVVYPQITGALRVNGTSASGQVRLSASFRAQLKSGATAENVSINAVVQPTAATTVTETASEIIFRNLRFAISGSANSGSAAHEYVEDLRISKSSATAPITVDRSFELRTDAGELESASVSVTFPVTIHQ